MQNPDAIKHKYQDRGKTKPKNNSLTTPVNQEVR